jgi:hypothetical protein
MPFIDSRLQRYVDYGDGANVSVARNLQSALRSGNLDSFATFYASRRIYQLPVAGNAIRPAVRR